jgi:hypothetical protein
MSNNTNTESQDFLGAIHLLKQELSEVIETKIALAINQMTHHKVQASPTYLFPPIPNYRIQKNQYPIYMPPQTQSSLKICQNFFPLKLNFFEN